MSISLPPQNRGLDTSNHHVMSEQRHALCRHSSTVCGRSSRTSQTMDGCGRLNGLGLGDIRLAGLQRHIPVILSANQLAGLAHSTTAWINGVHLFLNWSLTFPIGIVFDKRGSNMLLFVGSAFYLAGIFGMAESSRFWQFMVTYGILGGAGSAILSTVAISVLGHWFDKRKGLATGTVILGGSLGGVVFPLALRPMFEEIGWSWSIRALGFFLTILIGLGLFTVRSRAPVMHTRPVAIRSVLRPTFLLATLGIGGKSHQSSYAHQQLIPGRFRFRLIWSPWTAPRVWAKFRTHRGNWLSLGRHCQRVRTLPFCAGILS